MVWMKWGHPFRRGVKNLKLKNKIKFKLNDREVKWLHYVSVFWSGRMKAMTSNQTI